MYSIKVDGEYIYSPLIGKMAIDITLNQELNTSGTLKLSLPTENKNIIPLKSKWELFRDNKKIFEGRMIAPSKNLYGITKYEVLGALDYFNDSVLPPFSFTDKTVTQFLAWIIEQHNSQVDDFKKFKMGNCDVTDDDSTENIVRSCENYSCTWDIIKSRLLDKLTGNISVRFEEDGNYIDYLNTGNKNSQKIEFRKNLIELTDESSASDICSVLIPLGKKSEEGEGIVDITLVNDNKNYIENADLISKYGRITKVLQWEDVTEPLTLLHKAQRYLNSLQLARKVEVKAVDLNLVDKGIQAYKLGDVVTCVTPTGENITMQISSMTTDIGNPSASSITFGNIDTITAKNLRVMNATEQAIELIGNTKIELYKTKQGLELKISDTEKNISTTITTTADGLRKEFTDADNGLSTKIQENAEGLKSAVMKDNIGTEIEQHYSNVKIAFNKINSSFVFDENGLVYTHPDGNTTEMGKNGFIYKVGSNSHEYHSIYATGRVITNASTENAVEITLPDEFKNKKVGIVLSLWDTAKNPGVNHVLTKISYWVKDWDNGSNVKDNKFRIIGYAMYSDNSSCTTLENIGVQWYAFA